MNDPSTAKAPDVRQLEKQADKLKEQSFPGFAAQAFRCYIDPRVHAAIQQHAKENTTIEICGVLVGRWVRDTFGPYVEVSASIRGQDAESKFAEVTFTHETWAKIHAEMDRSYPELAIVGWYHTHPDFGIFLSDRDRFIHEHFFSEPGQIAYVVDPIRQTEGIFAWTEGKATLMPHFWVGSNMQVSTAAGSETAKSPSADLPAVHRERVTEKSPPSVSSPFPNLLILVATFTALLLGYFFGSFHSDWQRARLIDGVVAHYGIWKGLRPGLEQHLQETQKVVSKINRDVQSLSTVDVQNKDAAEQWRKKVAAISQQLALSNQMLNEIRRLYCLSAEEQLAVQRQIIAQMERLESQTKRSNAKKDTQPK